MTQSHDYLAKIEIVNKKQNLLKIIFIFEYIFLATSVPLLYRSCKQKEQNKILQNNY